MYEDHNRNEEQRSIQIRQQNINKSLISQLDLLQSLRHDDYDVCTIQEPYIDFRGKTRANRQWITVYPNTHQEYPDKTRSIILVNTNLSTDTWKQLQFRHPDITAVEITGNFGTLQIINVYNDGDNNDALTHISAFMRDPSRQRHTASPVHDVDGRLQPTSPTMG